MDLELRLLRSLLVVAEERHLGRAAERLTISQPALSRQMQVLEARVAAPLLVRLPRGVELTEAGRVLAADARRLVDDSDRALDRARRAGRGDLGHLRVGFIASAADRLMAPLLRRLSDRSPGLTFSLTERVWTHQAEGLEEGADDVAFVRDLSRHSPWELLVLLEEPVCLVVRDTHPLAGATAPLTREDLARFPEERYLGSREWIGPREARWGLDVEVNEDIASPMALFAFVRSGFGTAVMPESYVPLAPGGLRFLPVAGERSVQQLAWPAGDPRPPVQALLELARGVP